MMSELGVIAGRVMLIGTTILSIFTVLCMMTSSAGGNSTKEVFATTIKVSISRKMLPVVLCLLGLILAVEILYTVVMSVWG